MWRQGRADAQFVSGPAVSVAGRAHRAEKAVRFVGGHAALHSLLEAPAGVLPLAVRSPGVDEVFAGTLRVREAASTAALRAQEHVVLAAFRVEHAHARQALFRRPGEEAQFCRGVLDLLVYLLPLCSRRADLLPNLACLQICRRVTD